MRADPAFDLIQLAAGIALLLRQLVERVGDIAGAVLLLLSFTTGFQQLAADLENLLVQGIGGEGSGDLARLIAKIVELRAQGLRQFGEVINNVLILTGALKGGITLLKRIQGRLQDFDGFRLGGLCRFRLFQLLICLASGAVAAYAPKLRHQANRKVYIRRTA
ncbi:Uncharacterised protein [Klebsiella oxytoca]|nr:Uncharacterised protein [Klebsiella oxytoca]VDY50118.1 Uncharacterised protein [Klebsiella oxytoca]